MLKGYKIRIYPTKEQEVLIWKHFDGCRFIYNHLIALQAENYKNGGKFIGQFNMGKRVTELKRQEEYKWLNELSSASLGIICKDVEETYKMFFNKTIPYPRFKKKKQHKDKYPVRSERFYFKKDFAHIEKLGKMKYKSDFQFPKGRNYKYNNVRISFRNGKYILSFSVECENQAVQLSGQTMGIDLGVKELAVVAYGEEQIFFHNINKSKQMKFLEKRILHYQRSISRKSLASRKRNGKYIKTSNIERECKKIRKLYAKRTNIRVDYIHKATHTLVSMAPKRVVMENLNIRGMLKNKHMYKSIIVQKWHEFIRQMKYKCEWNGIEFVQVDMFYPSSRMCSCCGYIKKDLKLRDRTFVCPKCGFQIDRDYNAAINLMRYEA